MLFRACEVVLFMSIALVVMGVLFLVLGVAVIGACILGTRMDVSARRCQTLPSGHDKVLSDE